MRKLILGDLPTLMGTSEKPSKIEWLGQNGVENIEGVQIISLASDMLPKNFLTYHEKLLALVEKFPFLKRVSVALNCWPLLETIDENKVTTDVAASTFLSADLYSYAFGVCQALMQLWVKRQVPAIDISFHPMLTWPQAAVDMIPAEDLECLQNFLWYCEGNRRKEFCALLRRFNISTDVNIENEPITSDQWGNLIHTGNRLFSEQILDLPR